MRNFLIRAVSQNWRSTCQTSNFRQFLNESKQSNAVTVRYIQTTNTLKNESLAPPKPVIKLPVPVVNRALKRHKRIENIAKEQDRQRLKRKPVVISCKRSDLNHRMGQTYGKNEKVPLASAGWMHRKSYDDYFTINSFQGIRAQNYTKKDEKAPPFSDLDLDPLLVDALHTCNFKTLTNIQAESLPSILQEKDLHTLIAAETGNGKTLCFLLPILQNILFMRSTSGLDLEKRPNCSPLSVIVTPSRELAIQIGSVARHLAEQCGIKVEVILGASDVLKGNRKLSKMDVVVGSFGGLYKLFNMGRIKRNFVTQIALDEIDTLVDDTFKDEMVPFLKKFGHSKLSLLHGIRVIMTGATFPTNFDNYMSDVFDLQELQKFSTNQIHKVLYHFPQKFIRVAPSRKLDNLMEILEKDCAKDKKKILIFCNKATTAEFLGHHLRENNMECITFTQHVHPKQRFQHFSHFAHGNINLMIATDLASRGLDTTMVHHVINYDFPKNPADYIHRVGRVGRVGSTGGCHVTSLLDEPLGIEVLQRIELAARKDTEIHNVNANIIRIIQHRANRKEAQL